MRSTGVEEWSRSVVFEADEEETVNYRAGRVKRCVCGVRWLKGLESNQGRNRYTSRRKAESWCGRETRCVCSEDRQDTVRRCGCIGGLRYECGR